MRRAEEEMRRAEEVRRRVEEERRRTEAEMRRSEAEEKSVKEEERRCAEEERRRAEEEGRRAEEERRRAEEEGVLRRKVGVWRRKRRVGSGRKEVCRGRREARRGRFGTPESSFLAYCCTWVPAVAQNRCQERTVRDGKPHLKSHFEEGSLSSSPASFVQPQEEEKENKVLSAPADQKSICCCAGPFTLPHQPPRHPHQ